MARVQEQMAEAFESSESSHQELQHEAHVLADDLISYRIGKRSTPPSPTSATLRRLSDELEEHHAVLLNNMCNQLNLTHNSARSTFTEVADEVFREGINWGRIVALFTFGGRLAQVCRRNGMAENAEQVSNWVGDYVAAKSDWIREQGGWEAFNQHFHDSSRSDRMRMSVLFLVALGVGALATFFYHVPSVS